MKSYEDCDGLELASLVATNRASPRELLDAARALGEPRAHRSEVPVLRSHGIGAQILQDLGVTRMRVLSAPKQLLGLAAFGLEVTEYVDENAGTEDLVRGARA